jgi:hypothetical protein
LHCFFHCLTHCSRKRFVHRSIQTLHQSPFRSSACTLTLTLAFFLFGSCPEGSPWFVHCTGKRRAASP